MATAKESSSSSCKHYKKSSALTPGHIISIPPASLQQFALAIKRRHSSTPTQTQET